MLNKFPGLAIGTVVSAQDPEQRGRLQVHVPVAQGSSVDSWALVANSKTAADGSRLPPEPGDKVIVGFLGGDTGAPIVIGWQNDHPLSAPPIPPEFIGKLKR